MVIVCTNTFTAKHIKQCFCYLMLPMSGMSIDMLMLTYMLLTSPRDISQTVRLSQVIKEVSAFIYVVTSDTCLQNNLLFLSKHAIASFV
jgi:hypothetical protein